MVELIEYSRVEVAKGEKQTQISIIKEFLESFEKNLEGVSQSSWRKKLYNCFYATIWVG